jgi:hypothetical protein
MVMRISCAGAAPSYGPSLSPPVTKIPNKAFSLVVYCCSTYYKVFHVGREGDSGGDTALFPCYSIADARLWHHAAARSAGANMPPDARVDRTNSELPPFLPRTERLACT